MGVLFFRDSCQLMGSFFFHVATEPFSHCPPILVHSPCFTLSVLTSQNLMVVLKKEVSTKDSDLEFNKNAQLTITGLTVTSGPYQENAFTPEKKSGLVGQVFMDISSKRIWSRWGK